MAARIEIAPEFKDRFIDQLFDLWVGPEIERRRAAGELLATFDFWGAQVILNFDGERSVRVNDEINVYIRGGFDNLAAGDPVALDELEDVSGLELTEADPNAGHLTLLRIRSGWIAAFDLRYNAARVAEAAAAAREFMDAAQMSLDGGVLRPVVDNLLSAAELMAKAALIMHDRELFASKPQVRHKMIGLRFKHWAELGNADPDDASLLDALKALRPSARYLDSAFELKSEEACDLLRRTENMYLRLLMRIPNRG